MSSAVDRAISDMPDSFVIKSFLELHRTEVKGMLLTEYNEAEAMELFREEGRAEGRAEGLAEGRAEGIVDTLISLVQKGLLSIKDAAAQLGITEVAFQQKMLGK
jgi:predicted transposase YdaD